MTIEMNAMQASAPAKINLSLKISERRDDGFHEIETLIAPISLFDQIDIEKQNRWIDFSCDDQSLSAGDDNLVVRAGAGLGGGSSDAAATLLALNQMFETKLSREKLAEIGSTIGSDVPFFVFGSAARCTGRGEIVTPTDLKQKLSILLLKPAFSVSSAWAYSRWRSSRELVDVSYNSQEFADQNFLNDLERQVFEKFAFLAQLKLWLLQQSEVGAALMSGSGSTVFAVIRPNAGVDLVIKRAREELDPELRTYACETL